MTRPDSGRGLPKTVPHVDTLERSSSDGPWTTKSGSKLLVNLKLSLPEIETQFSYIQEELDILPGDIRGFRICTNRGMPKGSVGGNEFHRIRQELFVLLDGVLKIISEDLYGNTRVEILNPGERLSMVPYIMHTVEAMEDETGFLETANTLFIPENPLTHDTYSREEFDRLKLMVASR